MSAAARAIVAVGKNIQQNIDSALGAMTPDDKQTIDKKFEELNAAVKKMSGQIDASTAKMAEFQLKLLQGELAKTGEDEMPSATTITQVVESLDNLPGAAETVVGLFATPRWAKLSAKRARLPSSGRVNVLAAVYKARQARASNSSWVLGK